MINDKDFDNKFNFVIEIFKQWMPVKFDYSKSIILDFGCGFGIMALAIALKLKPRKVIGVDINSYHNKLVDMVKDRLKISALPENLEFHEILPNETLSKMFKVDVIFTWSTFEHVNRPNLEEVIRELNGSLSENGLLFLQITPLYYSAFGSHVDTLINDPWAHLLMQNDLFRYAVMTTPKHNTIYKEEQDDNYEMIKSEIWSCYETLNKITADELIELFENNGFQTLRQIRTNCDMEPPKRLSRIFSEEILKNEQIVVLFQKATPNPLNGRGLGRESNLRRQIDLIRHPRIWGLAHPRIWRLARAFARLFNVFR